MDRFQEIDTLVASSDFEMRRLIVGVLKRLGTRWLCVSTVRQSIETIERENVGLVFCDREFPDGTYQDLMTFATNQRDGGLRVVLTTNFIYPGEYQEAKRWGVFEVIASPCASAAVEWMVIRKRRDDLCRRDALLERAARVAGLTKPPMAGRT